MGVLDLGHLPDIFLSELANFSVVFSHRVQLVECVPQTGRRIVRQRQLRLVLDIFTRFRTVAITWVELGCEQRKVVKFSGDSKNPV